MKQDTFESIVQARYALEGDVFTPPQGADSNTAFNFVPAAEIWQEEIKPNLDKLRGTIAKGMTSMSALGELHMALYELEIALLNKPITFGEAGALVKARRDKDFSVLMMKNSEYSTEDNKLANFYESAEFGFGPAMTLYGFMIKHVNSVKGMVDGKKPVNQETIDEKLGDFRRYLLLLEALWLEMFRTS